MFHIIVNYLTIRCTNKKNHNPPTIAVVTAENRIFIVTNATANDNKILPVNKEVRTAGLSLECSDGIKANMKPN